MKNVGRAGLRWSSVVILAVGAVAASCGSDDQSVAPSLSEQEGTISSPLTQFPSTGNVSTIAGVPGTPGYTDGALGTNLLNEPAGVAVASDGTVYIADWNNNAIRRIKTDGTLDTFLKGSLNYPYNPLFEDPVATKCAAALPANWAAAGVSTDFRTVDASCVGQVPGLTGTAYAGSQWAYGTGGITQTIALSSAVRTAIGRGQMHGRIAVQTREDAGGKAEVLVEYLNSTGGVVASFDSGVPATSTTTWRLISNYANDTLLPTSVRSLRFTLKAVAGKVAFDSINLHLIDQSQPASNDAGLTGPTSVAVDPSNGVLYVAAADGLFTVSNQVVTRITANPGYNPPVSPTSVSAVQNHKLIADSGNTKLHIRDGNGVQYYFDVGGVPNAEPLAATGDYVTLNGNPQYSLFVTYRGLATIRAWTCPGGNTINGATIACSQVLQVGSTAGYADNKTGTIGSERFGSSIVSIALGANRGLMGAEGFIADYNNNAIRRIYYPYTLTSAGTTVAGSTDGAPGVARFFGPSAVAVTPNHNLVVADRLNNTVRLIACGDMNVCAAMTGGHPSNSSDPVCGMQPTAIDDGNLCTTDSCEILAITHANNTVSCNDGNACTGNDACSAGACLGATISVDDQQPCTIDSCDPATGPAHTPKTFTDSDPNDCKVPVCDTATGNAKYVAVPEGTGCQANGNKGRCGLTDSSGNATCETSPTFAPSAPPVTGGATDFGDLTGPIWAGSSPIQKKPDGTNVPASQFEPGHAGWLFGIVKTAAGLPIANVTVSIANDAGYGQTKTRDDGRFDLIVNGGRIHTVRFAKAGHLPVDRDVYVGWEESRAINNVILLTPDANSKVVDFKAATGTTQFYVATGSTSTDADGTRTAKLMVPIGTTASINNVTQGNLTLRLTEYTVGSQGPDRMPAPLPPSSAYTYAVEISADESLSVGGTTVKFNKAVYAYVDNFVSTTDASGRIPVKTIVPSGYYDRDKRAWIPASNGLVIKVLKGKQSIASGSPAQIDVTGDGIKDNDAADGVSPTLLALGFTREELIALRDYDDGATLWRVPIDHMTPWDFNFAPAGGCGAACDQPAVNSSAAEPLTCETQAAGSIIGCDSQSLGESLAVPGTSFTLNYNSARSPLSASWRKLHANVDARPKGVTVTVTVTVAGRVIYAQIFDEGPGTVVDIDWDGKDAFGREVVGSATGVIDMHGVGKYQYDTSVPDAFDGMGHPAAWTMKRVQKKYEWQDAHPLVMPAYAPPEGTWSLAGWTLSATHFYDPKSHLLYLGTGQVRKVDPGLFSIKRVAGSGVGDTSHDVLANDNTSMLAPNVGVGLPNGLARRYDLVAAPNGDVIFIDPEREAIRKIDANGIVKTIAGSVTSGGTAHSCSSNGDGLDSLAGKWLGQPQDLAVNRDGDIYVNDVGDHTVRVLKAGTGGTYIMGTVAGKCGPTGSNIPDGAVALGTALDPMSAIAAGPNGYVYVAGTDAKIRRFKDGGKLETVAGNGTDTGNAIDPSVTGQAATSVAIGKVLAMAVGEDGAIYATSGKDLFRVLPNGTIQILSGKFPATAFVPKDNVPFAGNDYADGVKALAVTKDGRVFFNDSRQSGSLRVLESDGIVKTVARLSTSTPIDGSSALFNGPRGIDAIAVGPDGAVLTASLDDNSIYRLLGGSGLMNSGCDSSTAHFIPNGDEGYCFDKLGRHRSTINARTGKTVLEVGYDANTKLQSVKQHYPNDDTTKPDLLRATGLAFDDTTKAWSISAPFGQVTKVTASEISDSLGKTSIAWGSGGLLGGLTDRNFNDFTFTFTDGLLTADKSPLGVNPQTLSRSSVPGRTTVTHTTPLGRVTTYDSGRDIAGFRTKTVTYPDLTKATRNESWFGGSASTAPDGTQVTVGSSTPDPIFGLRDPVPGTRSVTLPSGGISSQMSETRCGVTTSNNVSTQFIGFVRSSTPLTCAAGSDPFASQPAHTTVKRVWSASGEVITTTSPEGRVNVETRDAVGRRKQLQVGQLTPLVYNFDATNLDQLAHVDRGSRKQQFEYQTTGNDKGFVAAMVDAALNRTEYKRDIYGRPLQVTEAKGVAQMQGVTTLDWDGNGNLKLVTPPRVDPNDPLNVAKFAHNLTYDAINGVKQYKPPVLTDVPSPQTDYTPTADRTPNTEVRPDGVTITHNLAQTLGAQSGAQANLSDQIDTITFPNNATPTGKIDYDYYLATDTNYSGGQAPGKVKSILGPYGTTLLSFEYNGAVTTKVATKNVLSSTEAASSVAWSYDSALRRNSETVAPIAPWTGKTLLQSTMTRYVAYDNDDLLTCNSYSSSDTCSSLTCSSGDCNLKLTRSSIHGAVTALDWGSTATDANKLAETWEYSDTSADQTAQTAFGELRRQKLVYDVSLKKTFADIVYDSTAAPRDTLGRVYVKTETFPEMTAGTSVDTVYDYDERGRLEKANKTGVPLESFGYDTNGNRTSCTSGGKSYAGVYDEQDRLSTYGASTTWATTGDIKYTYGKNGEQKKREIKNGDVWDYAYDPLGNLTSVTQTSGGTVTTFTYLVDGVGRRIARKKKVGTGANTVTNRWIYRDKLAPVGELDATGRLVSLFIYGSRANVPDFVVKIDPATAAKTIYRLFSDQLGSPRLAVNINDRTDTKYRVDYSAFGVPDPKLNSSGVLTDLAWIPFGFAGGLYDKETGLERFGARDYDPTIGRWVSKDPILFGGGQSNVYVYVGNDPVNRKDPTGLAVYLCSRIAELTGNQQKDLANGFRHWWIWNSEFGSEAGMGPTPGGWGGIGGFFTSSSITDHRGAHGENSWKDVQCESMPDVDEACSDGLVNESQYGKDLGHWFPYVNDCGTFAMSVITACDTNYSGGLTNQCTFDGSDACGSW